MNYYIAFLIFAIIVVSVMFSLAPFPRQKKPRVPAWNDGAKWDDGSVYGSNAPYKLEPAESNGKEAAYTVLESVNPPSKVRTTRKKATARHAVVKKRTTTAKRKKKATR